MSLVDAIPQTIKEIGRLRGQGQLARGAYGQSLADIGQMVAGIPEQMRQRKLEEQQAQIRAQQMEAGALELAEKKRAAAADEALSNAMAQALAPDGTIDPQKLTQHIAGTPAAAKLPEILQHLTAMQKATVDLDVSRGALDESQRDEMGALAAAAEAAGDDPDTQAGVLLTGIASRVKRNRMTQDEARPIIANLMGDVDGEGPAQPDPEKVTSTIARMKAASKEQRQLQMTEAQKDAAAENALAARDERKLRALGTQVQNFSRQLSNTTTKEQYARVYQGVPKDARPYFDSPEEWTPESATRAADVLLTPDQRSDNARADDAATRADAAAAETRRHNQQTEQTAREREGRLRSGGGSDESGVYSTTSKRGYDAFVENYLKRHPAERLESVTDPDVPSLVTTKRVPVEGAVPPPSIEKWHAMTSQERQKVLADPNARIDDATLARRQGGEAPPHEAASATPPSGQGKMVTMADLEKIAKAKGTTVDVQRERYIKGGYAVVK